jgi:hypothetical protein
MGNRQLWSEPAFLFGIMPLTKQGDGPVFAIALAKLNARPRVKVA